MAGPIVVPLDGSAFAEVALPMARLLAERTEASLHLVHVTIPTPAGPFHPEDRLELMEHAETRALRYLEARTGVGQGVRRALLPGEDGVAAAVGAYARKTGASWIVLTTHGGGGLSRLLMGSAAEALIQNAVTPLLFLRPWDPAGELAPGERPVHRLLVPLDGSEESEAALAPATALARAFGAAVDVMRVVPPRAYTELHGIRLRSGSEAIDREAAAYLTGQVEALRAQGLQAEAWRTHDEDAAEGILTAAAERGSDLVVMSTHGRSGLERAVVGSVADRVLRKSGVALALVRPPPE